ARLAFGRPLETRVRWEEARVALALDADFLGQGPYQLRDARDFVRTREPEAEGMSRLYVAEAHFTVTGMFADHRFRMRPTEVERFAVAVLGELARVHGLPLLERFRELAPEWPERSREVKAVARDLARHGERAVVVAGNRQPPRVHAVAHALNAALGSQQRMTVHHEPMLDALDTGLGALSELVEAARAGQVDTLVMTAWNPVYTAPVDVDLRGALGKVPNSVYLALRRDETAEQVRWFLPQAHLLESWGDARAQDGTASIIQPLISPLYRGLTELDALAPFVGVPDMSPYHLVREYWKARGRPDTFDEDWEQWLAVGVIPGTEAPAVTPELDWESVAASVRAFTPREPEAYEINFLPGYMVHDGRYFDNAWLQELPHPLTQLSWTNAPLLSPLTAKRLGVEPRDMLRLTWRERTLEAAVYILPGHADDTVSLELGYGRLGPEPTREQLGFNAYQVRHADAPWFAGGLRVEKLEGRYPLATTQDHWGMHGREIALQDGLEEYLEKKPGYLQHLKGPVPKLYEPFQYADEAYKWAMAVDLNRCTGCAACMVACQAENNIPVVGRGQVERSREMYWLRVDRYFQGDEHEPAAIPQPMMCQHCEQAPCEYVCPVNATVHSDEGLNEMIYNRCIGTRYCSNNCPYKVRRFNYLNYHQNLKPVEQLRFNPEVTVRMRGEMEKCTYCVQRSERARIAARIERTRIDTEALQTACQQVCPTEAIVFGSLHERSSPVARLHESPRHYAVLHELGTQPRTVYLARIKNRNPELTDG
ncbi:MAG TPA: 4Fe-4S dicluster domain-containing protein, partial [Myxococcaceae bacterium]|nr:4Fe-4S dicluster domain-containing protein [Myxococcaceae bacterium]